MKYGIRQKAKNDSDYNGDSYLILENKDMDLIGVVDGLGSGAAAFHASQKAIDIVRTYQEQSSLQQIVLHCHEGLKGTRGAVIGLCRIDKNQSTLSFIGIGNVTLQVIEKDKISRPPSMWGMIGHVLTRCKTFDIPFKKGHWAALYSDSIPTDFDFRPYISQHEDPQTITDTILEDLVPIKDDFTLIMIKF